MKRWEVEFIVIEQLKRIVDAMHVAAIQKRNDYYKKRKYNAAESWRRVQTLLRERGPLTFTSICKALTLTNNRLCDILRKYKDHLRKVDGKWTLTQKGAEDEERLDTLQPGTVLQNDRLAESSGGDDG